MNDFETIAEMLFPDITKTTDYYETLYPPRDLPETAIVTRFAPSPTGDMHLGNLFSCTVEERLAHQTGGVIFLRIEDTDRKREIKNGVARIVKAIAKFNVNFDEGQVRGDETEAGIYGPYRQTKRQEIYQAFAKRLISEGHAYPCFCTQDQIKEMRKTQKERKIDIGYYGEWAFHRNITLDEVKNNLASGRRFVVRLKSRGSSDKRILLDDVIKGRIEMPENTHDIPLLKSDGLPTYHFAHAVDDHLMRTTHVLRGDEWLSSVPIHFELFDVLGFKKPKFGHISPMMKIEGESRRKLSKRKDPEAMLEYYHEQGYHIDSVIEYLMTIMNSNYEDWRRANPGKPYTEFKVSVSKMGHSGALFDMAKLHDISRNKIAEMSTDEVYKNTTDWAAKYDSEFMALLQKDETYAKEILGIDRGGPKPRKDIAIWSEVKEYVAYFYDELFDVKTETVELISECISRSDAFGIIAAYEMIYNQKDENSEWFAKIRSLAGGLGYAPDMKTYKESPESYKGNVGDISALIRLAITGRKNTPDLHKIMQLLGYKRVMKRLSQFKKLV